MRTTIVLFIISALLILTACATSSYSVGKDFSSEDVSKIAKGKTTKADLLKLLGEPFSKTVISSTGEKWIYTYSAGTASAQNYLVTAKVETRGIQKTLDILIEDGVVTNYTFTEWPAPNASLNSRAK